MAIEIGAGSRILLADAANPMNAANGGSDDNLDDVTHFFTAFSFTNPLNPVDSTTLKADVNGYTRDFIAGLMNAQVNGNYFEAEGYSCAMMLRLDAIKKGTNHTKGRGKVDFRVLVGGADSGNAQIDGTILVTEGGGLTIDIENPLGNPFGGQVVGELELSEQD